MSLAALVSLHLQAEITSAFHEEILRDFHTTISNKTFAEHVAEFYETIYNQVAEKILAEKLKF